MHGGTTRVRMAEFTYRSRIFGDYTFSAPDEGGTVTLKGKQLTAFGGYMASGRRDEPLRADRETLERAARRWWKLRTDKLAVWGHRASGIKP